MIRLTSQFIIITSPSSVTMGKAIVSNKYKRLQSVRVYIITELLQRILFWEENRYLEENEIYVLQEVRWKLFCFYYCKQSPSSHWRSLWVHLHFLHATEDPQRKHPGGWVIDSTEQTGREEMMGSGGTCAGTESLIHLIDDRPVSPWKLTIDGTWPL